MHTRRMKYNPAFLTDEELIESFVVREDDLDAILGWVRDNTTGSNQHVLVIGPRGIGKTTLVLRVAAEIRRTPELAQAWYPLVFSEESYEVSTPGEFWLEALFHLAEQTKDERWTRTHEELKREPDETRLRERALAQLLDFADAQGKRLLLVVENLNLLLGDQIGDDQAWVIRHTLLHEPRVMLLASATSRFKEVDNHEKAFFETFKYHPLRPLNLNECGKVWVSVTGEEAPPARMRAIQILTGGSPRLLAIIGGFSIGKSFQELLTNLTQLVDDHTEYFKSHLENLPAAERKVYTCLAELFEPSTSRQVGEAARLTASVASANLKRLVSRGAVAVVDGGKRTKTYQLAERMYNIYYLMRRRGTPSSQVQALVQFMIRFYGPEEVPTLVHWIAEEACGLAAKERETHFLAIEHMLRETVEVCDKGILDDRLWDLAVVPDAPKSIQTLVSEGALNQLLEGLSPEEKARRLAMTALSLAASEELVDRAEKFILKALRFGPNFAFAHAVRARLHSLQGNKEAEEMAHREATRLDLGDAGLTPMLELLLHENRYAEAAEVYYKLLELRPDDSDLWCGLGNLLAGHLGKYEEAEKALQMATKVAPQNVWAWRFLAMRLTEDLGRYDEAEKAYRRALELEPRQAPTWFRLGILLAHHLNRYTEAAAALQRSLELNPAEVPAWQELGMLLTTHLGRHVEAEESFRKAIELDPNDVWSWRFLGKVLGEHLQRYEEAEDAYRRAIELTPEDDMSWIRLGFLLGSHLHRPSEAEGVFRRVIELAPEKAEAYFGIAVMLSRQKRYTEALPFMQQGLNNPTAAEIPLFAQIEITVQLARQGFAREILGMLESSPAAEKLEPLIVGLKLHLGEPVRAAAEVMEIGKDVKNRIEGLELEQTLS